MTDVRRTFMDRYREDKAKSISSKRKKLASLLFAGALVAGTMGIYSMSQYNLNSSKNSQVQKEVRKQKSEIKSIDLEKTLVKLENGERILQNASSERIAIPEGVPKQYVNSYRQLINYGVNQKEIDTIYNILTIETGHKHYTREGNVVIGKAGEIGIGQLLPESVEEVFRKTFDEREEMRSEFDSRAKKLSLCVLWPYLIKHTTKQERDKMIDSYKTRMTVVERFMKLVKYDKYANFSVSFSSAMYCRANAMRTAKIRDVDFFPEMAGSWYNAPKATRLAIKEGVKWDQRVPKITRKYVKKFRSLM